MRTAPESVALPCAFGLTARSIFLTGSLWRRRHHLPLAHFISERFRDDSGEAGATRNSCPILRPISSGAAKRICKAASSVDLGYAPFDAGQYVIQPRLCAIQIVLGSCHEDTARGADHLHVYESS